MQRNLGHTSSTVGYASCGTRKIRTIERQLWLRGMSLSGGPHTQGTSGTLVLQELNSCKQIACTSVTLMHMPGKPF